MIHLILLPSILLPIDISTALAQSDDKTLRILDEYIRYLRTIPLQDIINFSDAFSNVNLENEELEDISNNKILPPVILENIPEFLLPVAVTYNGQGKKVFKTQKKYKINSIILHNFLCGCNNISHIYFTSNTTKKNFLEGHHMIPLEYQHQYWNEYKINLDCTQNIIPLCPHCHSKIHYATVGEKNEILGEIFYKYKEKLKDIDPRITLSKFASFYNVYIY